MKGGKKGGVRPPQSKAESRPRLSVIYITIVWRWDFRPGLSAQASSGTSIAVGMPWQLTTQTVSPAALARWSGTTRSLPITGKFDKMLVNHEIGTEHFI